MYLITMELLGPSVPPALGPCDLSPQNSYLKHAAVGPNHISGVKLLIKFCSFAAVKTTAVMTHVLLFLVSATGL